MKWRKASDPPKKDDWYYIKFGGTKRCAMFRDGEWEAPYPTDNETFIWLDETEEQTTSVDVEQAAKDEYHDETGTFLEMPNQSKVILQRKAFIAGAKWNQGKGAGETVKGDGWIDVNDELPKLNIEYNIAWDMDDGDPELVTTTMEFRVEDKKWIDTRNDDIEVTKDVRFWRELPKPPLQKINKND